ncbi:hypothetical protein RRG08_049874 [Elysia crispata]|uniref:Uncharacterized protein n=1 Tax=Elysia crispata TaxID=231223 RepID=A0AAE0XZH1_9GAST|nr:hypothetical protein RRG08_049874 [Elysia crispata]
MPHDSAFKDAIDAAPVFQTSTRLTLILNLQVADYWFPLNERTITRYMSIDIIMAPFLASVRAVNRQN